MSKTGYFILLIAASIIVRAFYFYAQPDLSTDHLSQMAMAQNFMDGNGFSFKYLNTEGNIYYTTHIQWPPLYPLVMALVSFITSNLLLSSFLIQTAVLILLVIVWRKTFNLFRDFISDESFFYFISFLIISTSILNNINTILVFALLLLSVSLHYTYAYLFNEKSRRNIILSAIFAALLFWTHYGYFLVAFYPAVVMFIIFYLRRDRNYFYMGAGSFSIGLAITSSVLIYNFITTGNINYMDNPDIWDAGFFPEHLLLTDPFFLNAFFKTSYFFDYLWKTQQDLVITLAFQFISLTILALIVFFYVKLRKNKILPFEKTSQIFIPFFVIIVLVLVFLLYFTLRYHEIPRPNWTHIGDPRYMSAVYMSVAAIVVILLFIKAELISSRIIKPVKLFLMVLILINLAINIYITTGHWGKYSFEAGVYKVPEQELTDLYNYIKLEQSAGNLPVFIDNDLTVRSVRISQYAGAAVISSEDVLKIENFPETEKYFFILPESIKYRNEDIQLLSWGRLFNLNLIGHAYTNLDLFGVSKNLIDHNKIHSPQ